MYYVVNRNSGSMFSYDTVAQARGFVRSMAGPGGSRSKYVITDRRGNIVPAKLSVQRAKKTYYSRSYRSRRY